MLYGSLFAGKLFQGGLFRGSLFGAGGAVIPPEFTLQMETTGADETITLPMTGTVDVDIDWDDGSAIETFTTASPSHVYATAGTHDIKITGSCNVFGFANGGDKLKLLAVLNGGTGFTVGSFFSGFWGCTNLVSADFKGLNTSATTAMENMFRQCANMTTCDVSDFNTAKVTSMASMFNDCSSLTAIDVSSFNTAKVTSIANMFRNCSSLTTLNVSGWNTADVLTMLSLANGCTSLATLDVSGWDTVKVTNMQQMFNNCPALTSDPGIHAFNVTALTTAASMCFSSNNMLSTAEYNTILTNWEAQAVLNDVTAHFGDATHSGDGSTARAALVLPVIDGGHGWSITDGGAAL